MTTLSVLTTVLLWAAPTMSTEVVLLPGSVTECRSRTLSALVRLEFVDIREPTGAVIASSKTHSVSVACAAGNNETIVSITAAGPGPEAVALKVRDAIFGAALKGNGPFTARWDGGTGWGVITLEQNGAKVTGHYTCCGSGLLSGTVNGNIARMKWRPMASGEQGGEVMMRVMNDGGLEGSWCYGEGCEPTEEHAFTAARIKR